MSEAKDIATNIATDIVRVSGYISGPRWAIGVELIYDLAASCELEVVRVQEHKGLLSKTIGYTLEGTKLRQAVFSKYLNKAIKEYNG